MEFTIYTDGGCHGNRRDSGCLGGYGYYIHDAALSEICMGGGKATDTTNNRMEMMAVIKGITALKEELNEWYNGEIKKHDCIVMTDSKYVCDNFDDYLPTWKSNGWRKSKGGLVLNIDLWKKIDELTPEFKSFRFKWVKGHSKSKFNNLVDQIAQDQIAELKSTPQT